MWHRQSNNSRLTLYHVLVHLLMREAGAGLAVPVNPHPRRLVVLVVGQGDVIPAYG